MGQCQLNQPTKPMFSFGALSLGPNQRKYGQPNYFPYNTYVAITPGHVTLVHVTS